MSQQIRRANVAEEPAPESRSSPIASAHAAFLMENLQLIVDLLCQSFQCLVVCILEVSQSQRKAQQVLEF